jgi:hypothetical protein
MSTKRPLFLTLLVLFALCSLSGLVWNSNSLYGRQSSPRTANSTIEIVDQIHGENATKIRFRNASNKSINALQISVDGSVFMVEFLDADEPNRKLKPGGIYEEWFSTATHNDLDVSVLAVVFEDQTGVGDERMVEEVLETRRGVKKQLMRFGVELRAALASQNVDAMILDKLNAKLDSPLEDDPTDSGGVRLGQRKARQQIRHDLDAIKRLSTKPDFDIRNGLITIQRQHTQRIAEIQ